jgi:hypothetical protein
VDLRYMNSFQRVPRFKNEKIESLGGMLRKKDWKYKRQVFLYGNEEGRQGISRV